MSVPLIGSGGLFTRIGKAVKALNALNTFTGTTNVANDLAILTALNAGTPSLAVQGTGVGIQPASDTFINSGTSSNSVAAQYCQALLIQMVFEDNPQAANNLNTSLVELIRQIKASSDSVDANTIGITTTTGGSNVGNAVVVTSTKRGDGLVNENAIAEDIAISVTSNATPGSESLLASGQVASSNKLLPTWPSGSGTSHGLTVVDSTKGSNLLTNGSFETDSVIANAPDNWNVVVGTIGTTLLMTNVEVQTVTLTGSPTTGTYVLIYTDASSRVYLTAPIPFNSGSSTVQTALRALPGLGGITVAQSGTAPNLIHTITFTGISGNITQLSNNNYTDGTVTNATITNGTTHSYTHGRSVQFLSNGSELTKIRQAVNVSALTQYAFNIFIQMSATPSAGVMKVSLTDGTAVINDAQSVANSFTVALTGISTTFVSKTGVFRLPTVLPPMVYLQIELTTAIDSAKSLYFDDAVLTPMTELYSGGVYASVFAASIPLSTADTWNLAITNNNASPFQLAFDRMYGMKESGLLLPSSGSPTIAASLCT